MSINETYVPKSKLISMSMNGNMHDVVQYCRMFGLSDFFVQAETQGSTAVVVFRLPIDWPCDNRGPLSARG